MKTHLSPYLNFNGKCREAMTFYQACLGGELTLQKIAESPMGAQLSAEAGNHILHSHLRHGALELMGSDMMGAGVVRGNQVTLCLNCSGDQEIRTFFSRLSDGGQVITPLHQSFWGATYGELTDKFGMTWMLSYAKD
ncbi:PhnB protein [Catalinimonas alkaloidigena]|uniref:PhnB protein n=1 Tax=Catalinimonas alkaloidigena TaxID=1075417 RepID=A0A1G8X4T7_9BACT|nr:VOC family protein [Catalinimonas alkaloidigena]SDJ85638.1 PhnB protein [Catalinimonas alkaloidigena]